MNNRFPQYSPDYISKVMSLRKPQEDSLKILDDIVNSISLKKGMNLRAALGAVHAMYPICSDFERDFMSLTFALATGVGKTRLILKCDFPTSLFHINDVHTYPFLPQGGIKSLLPFPCRTVRPPYAHKWRNQRGYYTCSNSIFLFG